MSIRHSMVTGANSGLGLEFVRQLLARGGHVVAACRHPGKATALNTLAGGHPGRLHVLPLDVASEKSRTELARELPLVLGDDDGLSGRLDLLINNAWVLHSGERWGHVQETILEDSVRTNAFGPMLLAQALAPQLADGATVANLSSMMASLSARAEFRAPSYCISKAAQNMATVLLAKALSSRDIKVVALSPGWVQTDMGGDGAEITPAQSAAGLLQVIDALTPVQSGAFLDWQGRELSW